MWQCTDYLMAAGHFKFNIVWKHWYLGNAWRFGDVYVELRMQRITLH